MSAAAPPAPPTATLDLQEQIARIDRALAENHKFQAETDKLFAEAAKLRAEAPKLQAEARKFGRDPWFILVAAVAGGLLTQLPAILRGLGWIA